MLINHGMNCQIEVNAILKVTVGTGLSELLHSPVNVVTYGRVARILCNGKPTFDVIEVSAPIDPETALLDPELRATANFGGMHILPRPCLLLVGPRICAIVCAAISWNLLQHVVPCGRPNKALPMTSAAASRPLCETKPVCAGTNTY